MARGGRRPGSGRPKGSKNKRSIEITSRLAELNCNPIEGLALVAKQAMQNQEYSLAAMIYKELAQYMAPKMSAKTIQDALPDKAISEKIQHAIEKVETHYSRANNNEP